MYDWEFTFENQVKLTLPGDTISEALAELISRGLLVTMITDVKRKGRNDDATLHPAMDDILDSILNINPHEILPCPR